ncbi:hypothetical protein EWM64_g3329 [Hericium alpestre]|uniref:Endoplasmic reticulum transmembrane protein n=1 Tax=Hericium alpestre TaxID=135208 RepID=A0A4Z0A1Y5_9AGAM|nr:hypothetical protein EWM64_g3329 [Hericium alpestre]
MTFMLLAGEMGTFCLLVAPLPFQVKRKLFHFLSESPVIAKIAYGLKISFIFVAILFVDALQRMFRVTAEVELAKTGQQIQDVRTETNFAARKFYAQRNTYLTGFCIFLSLVLTRSFYIIQDLIHTQEEYAKLKKATADKSRSSMAAGDQAKQIEELKRKLAEKEKSETDFETLKKQAKQQAAEYDRLAEQYNKETEVDLAALGLMLKRDITDGTTGNRSSSASVFDKLSTELVDAIFNQLSGDHVDCICLGLCSLRLWKIARQHIEACFRKIGCCAGDRLICIGDYAKDNDLPLGMLAAGELEELQGTVPYPSENTLYQCGDSWPRPPYVEAWIIHSNLEMRGLHAADMQMWELLAGDKFIADPVRARRSSCAISRPTNTRRLQRVENINLGYACAIRICWSSDEGVSMAYKGGIHRGVWAGHRFDIVPGGEWMLEGHWSDTFQTALKSLKVLRESDSAIEETPAEPPGVRAHRGTRAPATVPADVADELASFSLADANAVPAHAGDVNMAEAPADADDDADVTTQFRSAAAKGKKKRLH